MIKVANISIRSFDVDYLDVFWDIEPCHDDILNYEFIVERSQAEFGPFYPIMQAGLVDKYHVRDNTLKGRHSLYNSVYYRIRVRNKTTLEEKVFPENSGVKLSAPPDLSALEMSRLYSLKIKEFSGRKLFVFKRRVGGQRCGACYDKVTARKLRSACLVCFDTTWVGGFYTPIVAHGLIVTPAEHTQHSVYASTEQQNTILFIGNYPELFEGDVIVEAENIRWRVGSPINKVKKARSLIRQEAQLHSMAKGDIEYRLPINLSDEEYTSYFASPERNFTNPQNMAANSLSTAMNNAFSKRP